jgi:hypothetical protein
VIKKPRERGGHNPRWAAEREREREREKLNMEQILPVDFKTFLGIIVIVDIKM